MANRSTFTWIKILLIVGLFAQMLSPLSAFAETEESKNEEATTESSIPKLSESLDKQLDENQGSSTSSIIPIQTEEATIVTETEEVSEENQEEPNNGETEPVMAADRSGLSRAAGTGVDVKSLTAAQWQSGGANYQFFQIQPSSIVRQANPANPWQWQATINSTGKYTLAVGVWLQGTNFSYFFYVRTTHGVAAGPVTIQFTIPAAGRGKRLECRGMANNGDGTAVLNGNWQYADHANMTRGYIEAAANPTSVGGTITPQTRTYATNGVQVSGTAAFSLSNVTRSGTPQILFYTNATTASANPPNPAQAQVRANCSVSGSTLSFTATLAKGTTYYYRYYMNTNYSGIKVYSGYHANYRVTMPNIGIANNTKFSVTDDGLGFNTDCEYVLTHPLGGTATSVLPANSRIYFYTSLTEANNNQSVKKTSALTATGNNRVGISNYKDLDPGVTYWWRFLVNTNYSQINAFPGTANAYQIRMPKLTISNPTINPNGTNGAIDAAITSTLVGTEAEYEVNASKVYIFDDEEKANNKEKASAILTGNLSYSGNQMKIDNLTGLQPNKKYWARFYVSSNYSAINDWSEVVEFQTPYAVKEEYYAFSGTYLKEENKTIAYGSEYQLEGTDITHNGDDYVYYGWLNDSQTPGVDTPNRSPFTANTNTTVKLIYVKKDEAFFLRSVPKFDFGIVEPSEVNQDYTLDSSKYGGNTTDLAVEFLDHRATSTGWSLMAQLSDLEMNHSTTEKLINADLSMSRRLQLLDGSSNWSDTLPTGLNDYGGGDITLYAGGNEVNVFSSGTATPTDCNGIWRNAIDFNSVKLNVQGGTALKGATYSGKVIWKLNNTP